MGARQPPEHLVVGRIVRAHGVRGDVLAELTPQLEALVTSGTTVYVGDDLRPIEVESVRRHQKRHLITLAGVTHREGAERLRDAALRLRVDDVGELPPDTYYHWQILGMRVLVEGQELGEISEILETGANDVYVVRSPQGEEILLPAIEAVILRVDLERSEMQVRLLPGLRPETS